MRRATVVRRRRRQTGAVRATGRPCSTRPAETASGAERDIIILLYFTTAERLRTRVNNNNNNNNNNVLYTASYGIITLYTILYYKNVYTCGWLRGETGLYCGDRDRRRLLEMCLEFLYFRVLISSPDILTNAYPRAAYNMYIVARLPLICIRRRSWSYL